MSQLPIGKQRKIHILKSDENNSQKEKKRDFIIRISSSRFHDFLAFVFFFFFLEDVQRSMFHHLLKRHEYS